MSAVDPSAELQLLQALAADVRLLRNRAAWTSLLLDLTCIVGAAACAAFGASDAPVHVLRWATGAGNASLVAAAMASGASIFAAWRWLAYLRASRSEARGALRTTLAAMKPVLQRVSQLHDHGALSSSHRLVADSTLHVAEHAYLGRPPHGSSP
jgi:hypothetical protein